MYPNLPELDNYTCVGPADSWLTPYAAAEQYCRTKFDCSIVERGFDKKTGGIKFTCENAASEYLSLPTATGPAIYRGARL